MKIVYRLRWNTDQTSGRTSGQTVAAKPAASNYKVAWASKLPNHLTAGASGPKEIQAPFVNYLRGFRSLPSLSIRRASLVKASVRPLKNQDLR